MSFKINPTSDTTILTFGLLVLLIAKSGTLEAQETPGGAVPVDTWRTLVVPDTAEVEVLERFMDETKKLQPIKPEQYVEMQRSLRTVAKKMVELIKDRSSPQYRKAESEFVSASVMLLGNDGPDSQRKTFERFRNYLKDRNKIEFADIQMAILAGQNLEQLADYTLAKEAYRDFATIFREKKDPSLAEIIPMFEANAKRLDLPGMPLSLVGRTMSGEAFDIESLKGKFVLVYFWSSLTKSCEQEHPFMLSVYKKYQPRGFEIVGIGLDEKKEVAQAFIQRLEIPWINLWESRKNGTSKVMESFGVSAIPTLFLLDREGKVITIEARGLLLQKSLERLLPDPPVADTAKSESAESANAAKK
jgi:thiol-disulfide isomerase/thioredoxin